MPGCSLLAESCSYCRPGAHPPRDRSSPSLSTAVRSRGSREEDKEPGPGTRPQPRPSPVLPPGRAGCNVWEAPRPLRPRWGIVGKSVPRLPEGRRGGGGLLSLPGAGGDLTVTSHSSSSCCLPGFGAGGCPSFFLHVMEENAVPHTHHTPRAHKSAPSSRAGRRPGTAAIRSGECATGGHVPGQRRRDVPAREAEPWLRGAALGGQQLPPCSRRLRCRHKFGCSAVAAEFGRRRRKGRHCATPRERSGRRCAGHRAPGRARRWRRPEQQEEGRCRYCGRAPVRRCCWS